MSRTGSSNQAPSRLSEQAPDSRASGGGVPPMTPQEAIARYGQQLSAHERSEILDYPHIYYVGNTKARVPARTNYGFDDER
ncbi:serine/threonine protein kinase, CMGC, dual-specificity, partial [Kickxella alabastrina]